MAQIFHPSTNTISRVSLFSALFLIALLLWLLAEFQRSSYITEANVEREQPVQFSHKHHVADDGIDCRYCHTSVETSAFAGIPPTKDRKSTRLNSSHANISYAVFCLKKKKKHE